MVRVIWDKSLGYDPYYITPYAVHALSNSHFLVGGIRWADPIMVPGPETGILIRFTEGGSSTFEKVIPDLIVLAMDVALDETIALVGFTPRANLLAIHTLNSDGSLVWKRVYSGTYPYSFATGVSFRANGVLEIVGGSRPDTTTKNGDCWILRIDKDGNKLWEWSSQGYYLDPYGNLPDLVTLANGEIAVAGFKMSGDGSPYFSVTRLSAFGSLVWEQTFDASLEGGGRIASVPDRGVAIVLSKQQEAAGAVLSVSLIATDGTLVWERLFEKYEWNEPRAICYCQNNGILVVSAYSIGGGSTSWLLGIDMNGNLSWEWTPDNVFLIKDVHTTAPLGDDSLVVAGVDPGLEGGNLWLVSLGYRDAVGSASRVH